MMKLGMNKVFRVLACAALTCVAGAAFAASTYTLTIPSSLSVSGSGWNATSGITASGDLETGKKLTVTAESSNDFYLKSGANSIGYTLAAASTDTEATTTWEFETLSATAATQPMGIIVADISNAAAGTYTDKVTFTAKVEDAAKTVDLSTLTADYEAQDGETLTGTLDVDVKISIADGATVTLSDATINGVNDEDCEWAGLTCEGDATIILSGTNTVNGFYIPYPGIHVPENKTLTIQGDGTLAASSNGYGAGIGGGAQIYCGNIVIEGGTITADGGNSAAGIGSGYNASCGAITISGGTITATGGQHGAGIGSSYDYASCGNITISGGTITATGGLRAAGIGSGYDKASCGAITIASTVTRVTATKGVGEANSIGAGDSSSCNSVTIGGKVYWDGSNYQNGGQALYTETTFIYSPTN